MRIKNFLFSLLGIAAVTGCETPFKYTKQIMADGPLTLYHIAADQTPVAERSDSLTYKNGFEVLRIYNLTAEQDNELKNALAKGKNYSQADSKRCVFVPAYLIEKDTSFMIVISTSPCNKVSFAEAGKETMIDMVTENSIEKIVSKIAGH